MGMAQAPVVRSGCTAVGPPHARLALPAGQRCETLLADAPHALRCLPAAPYVASTWPRPGPTDARPGCQGRCLRRGRAWHVRGPPPRPLTGAAATAVWPPPWGPPDGAKAPPGGVRAPTARLAPCSPHVLCAGAAAMPPAPAGERGAAPPSRPSVGSRRVEETAPHPAGPDGVAASGGQRGPAAVHAVRDRRAPRLGVRQRAPPGRAAGRAPGRPRLRAACPGPARAEQSLGQPAPGALRPLTAVAPWAGSPALACHALQCPGPQAGRVQPLGSGHLYVRPPLLGSVRARAWLGQ